MRTPGTGALGLSQVVDSQRQHGYEDEDEETKYEDQRPVRALLGYRTAPRALLLAPALRSIARYPAVVAHGLLALPEGLRDELGAEALGKGEEPMGNNRWVPSNQGEPSGQEKGSRRSPVPERSSNRSLVLVLGLFALVLVAVLALAIYTLR